MAIRRTEAKIKKYAKAPEMLVSLKALYEQYRRGTKGAGLCCLCTAVGRRQSDSIAKTGKCKECPWVQVTGNTCQAVGFTNQSRLAELPGWIAMYELSVKQHYPVAVVPSIKTLKACLDQLRRDGWDVSLASKELTEYSAQANKIGNAKYYATSVKSCVESVLNSLK